MPNNYIPSLGHYGSINTVSSSFDPLSLSSLVAFWKLEEASGTRFDASANHNDLTANNSPGNTTGKVANAVNLIAASNQYLSRASTNTLQWGANDVTFWCWANLTSATASNSMTIASKGPSPLEMSLDYYQPSGVLRFTTYPTSSQATSGTFTLNTPHFIVCWQDITAGTLNIQVDNGTVNSSSYSGTAAAGSGSFCIGNWLQFGGEFWNGWIDQFGMTKSGAGGGGVLTSAQRAALWNGGLGV